MIAGSGLHTVVIRGGDAAAIVRRLRDRDGIDQVAPFGNDLHVVGLDPDRLGASVRAAIAGTSAVAEPDATSLEDVFIRLMSQSSDNFGNGAGAGRMTLGAHSPLRPSQVPLIAEHLRTRTFSFFIEVATVGDLRRAGPRPACCGACRNAEGLGWTVTDARPELIFPVAARSVHDHHDIPLPPRAAARPKSRYFSVSRVVAVMAKEFIQMRRDRLTFAMIIGVPILQLVLFGYAINTDPKHLPTAMIVADYGPIERSIVARDADLRLFRHRRRRQDRGDRARAARPRRRQLHRHHPRGFQRALVRGERPQLLVEADATDPAATANALGALDEIVRGALARETVGPLARLAPGTLPVDVIIHRRYNPEGITSYNIVPGLLGVILTMTTILMTSLALTREVERGTIENLLAMPARPYEIMVGKIVPYIGFGFVQVAVILIASQLLFNVPMAGSLILLLAATLLFIATNVTLGYTISTVARSQLQAMQMTFFIFLPSILLSGFMFPFRGMPQWAQAIGEAIPLTHFLRIVRGIMLKGANFAEIWPNVWPLAAIWAALATIALLRYRRTLD